MLVKEAPEDSQSHIFRQKGVGANNSSLRGCLTPPLDKMAAVLADDTFNCIFLKENNRIPIEISLKLVSRSPIDDKLFRSGVGVLSELLKQIFIWHLWLACHCETGICCLHEWACLPLGSHDFYKFPGWSMVWSWACKKVTVTGIHIFSKSFRCSHFDNASIVECQRSVCTSNVDASLFLFRSSWKTSRLLVVTVTWTPSIWTILATKVTARHQRNCFPLLLWQIPVWGDPTLPRVRNISTF